MKQLGYLHPDEVQIQINKDERLEFFTDKVFKANEYHALSKLEQPPIQSGRNLGVYTTAVYTTACHDCKVGTFCPQGTLEENVLPCPIGFVCPTPKTKVQCPANYLCNGAFAIECLSGMYCPLNATVQLECPATFYCPNPNLKISCPEG